MSRRLVLTLVAIALVGVLTGWVLWWELIVGDYLVKQSFVIDESTKLQILQETCWEVSVGYLYRVDRQGRTTAGEKLIGFFGPDENPRFEVVRNAETGVVALVRPPDATSVYVLYDPKTDERWSCGVFHEPAEHLVGQRLLERLNYGSEVLHYALR